MTAPHRSGKVQTVTGLISPHELGPTLMHEHLIINLNPPSLRATQVEGIDDIRACDCFRLNWGQTFDPANFRLDGPEIVIPDVREMMAAGGNTIVELTTGGLAPDPQALAAIARATGVQIVMGCGHYVEDYQAPENADRHADDFAREMVEQLTVGAWGTAIKAGIIGEIGCQHPWTDQEKRVMQGAVLAHREVGVAVNVHPGRNEDQPQEIVNFFRNAGGQVERLIMSHVDRTIFDAGRLYRLADSGCVIEFDLFGFETGHYSPNLAVDTPNDAGRIRLLRALADRGHIDQLLISHDIAAQSPGPLWRPWLSARLRKCGPVHEVARLYRGRCRSYSCS